MVAAATASQSYRQPSYHGTHDEPYSYYSESQSYNTPSYKSTHGASYYDEPITIKGKSYRLDVSCTFIYDSLLNQQYFTY